MGKRKNHSKRSMGSLPKGLPHKKSSSSNINPFESSASRHKGPKHQVHNRQISNLNTKKKNAAVPQQRRSQHLLQQALQRQKKANTFVDKRIGEYDQQMTAEEQNLARLVRERTRRSKKSTKFQLNDDNYDSEGMFLTHKGKVINDEMAEKSILLSDDDDDGGGNLDAMDTALHFGGPGTTNRSSSSAYGPSNSTADMAQAYSQRKTELDDLILRRKVLKAERIKAREQQEDVIADLDGAFKELSGMLQFRDKEQEIRTHIQQKRAGALDKDAQEMEDWDKEIREYSFQGKRAKATDRTKTPEELAKEEAERLHELETRRLARMNGNFSDDDFSDLSDDDEEDKGNKRKKRKKETQKKNKKKKAANNNPDELDDDSDDDDSDEEEELKAKFTPDGLVYVNKKGEVVKKFGEDEEEDSDSDEEDTSDDGNERSIGDDATTNDAATTTTTTLAVGTRVQGNYRAKEQYQEREHWYDGVISKVNQDEEDGTITYDIDYDDGDFEENVEPENVRPIKKSQEDLKAEEEKQEEARALKRKRDKARDKARQEMPFVFEAPTTLEALHDMIAKYASTGSDASLIIQRIHAANSVKLDRRNAEKMQNFYDVLLRRFMAVGDAIYTSGDGGKELGRCQQLDAITKVLYQMTQDSPDCAAAVWGRRFGILQNAHAKRLRDSELERDDDDDDEEAWSSWPSVGTVLLFRVVGHLFPVTDRRHGIVTPFILFFGQMLAQTAVESTYDLVIGTMIAGLLVEYAREAKRVVPEAIGFLAGVIRLYASDADERTSSRHSVPTLESAAFLPSLAGLRKSAHAYKEETLPMLRLEKSHVSNSSNAAASILATALHFAEVYSQSLDSSLSDAERETFAGITHSLLCLKPTNKKSPLPKPLQAKTASAASAVSDACKLDITRKPLARRSMLSAADKALKGLAPRLEDPERYSRSKDKGKSALQVAADRTRREYKREHKAVARELRLDAAFIEEQRRKEEESKTTRARAERHKNFAWLEGEQAAMNQQVRQGGGLLKGGGMGAAKAKAKSAKLGIKRGGKF